MPKKRTSIGNSQDCIFISYAHYDNTAIPEGQKGWVDTMHEYLGQRLPQVLGREARIWRDPLLRRHGDFHESLEQTISKIEILVAVISPPYIESEECLKELRQFCTASASSGVSIDTKTRIFKVLKTPIDDTGDDDDTGYPEELQGLLGYKFYEIDQSRRPREYSHQFNFDSYQKFIARIDDLAWDMKRFIKSCHPHISGLLPNPPQGAVYLAEVEPDLQEKRDNIKRELHSHGHHVLPDKDLPRDLTLLERAICEDLKQSCLSLHLMGEKYGEKEAVRSRVRLQYELAAAHSHTDPKFSQLIWMPRCGEAQDERQKAFLQYLRSEAPSHPQTEVLQDKLEDLKKDILDRLHALNVTKAPAPTSTEPADLANPSNRSGEVDHDPVRIYLICDGQDYESTQQLNDFLFDERFEVIRPLQEGNTAERLEDHDQQLSLCDVAIVFHGQANEHWMRQKLSDLRKSAGNDPAKKLLAKAVYLACPTTKQKEGFKTLEADVVRDCGDFPPTDLIRFLDKVRSTYRRDIRSKGVG